MRSERIQPHMTTGEVLVAMSDGNPGAMTVIMLMLRDGATIDPDNALGGLGHILSLDTLDICGPRIWLLFKDVCGENLRDVLAVLRSWQLGLAGCTREAIAQAIDTGNNLGGRGTVLDLEQIVSAVVERLPNFGGPTPAPHETKGEG